VVENKKMVLNFVETSDKEVEGFTKYFIKYVGTWEA